MVLVTLKQEEKSKFPTSVFKKDIGTFERFVN